MSADVDTSPTRKRGNTSPTRKRVDVQVELAYRLAFGRPPIEEEKAAVSAYARKHGLAKACRILLNANEFVFVD
jgi:hypothetical protein